MSGDRSHETCADHFCDAECPCDSKDFVIDHKVLAEYVKWLFGVELPLTVVRRQQKLDERTGLYTVRQDAWGHMRYKYDPDTKTISSIKITIVSGRTAKETLKTLAHELEHVKQLLDYGPAELKAAYKKSRKSFEKAAIEAEKHWLDMGFILKKKKQRRRNDD